MMLLGSSIEDVNGQIHQMANILPFKSSKGSLSVGYRFIKASKDSSLIKNEILKLISQIRILFYLYK